MEQQRHRSDFLPRVIVTAIAVWLANVLVPGIRVTSADEWWRQVLIYLAVGAVLALAQIIVKPFLVLFTFLLYILTLGLFGLVVNAWMLLLTDWVSGKLGWGLIVDGFWPAVWGGLVISVATMILSGFLRD